MDETSPTSSTAAEQAALITQAIAHGPITEAYHADPQQVVRALKRPRAAEIPRCLQYKQHA